MSLLEIQVQASVDAAELPADADVNNDVLEIVLLSMAAALSIVLVSCLWVFLALT